MFRLKTCFCKSVPFWTLDVIELEGEYRDGHPPVMAGSMEQTQWCREAFRFVRHEFASKDVTRKE